MSSIVNIDNIQALIESDISAWQIEKETGISRMNITNYRNGKGEIVNMSLANAIKLSEYWENICQKNNPPTR